MRTRRIAIGTAVALVGALTLSLFAVRAGTASPSAPVVPTGTAAVVRTTITSRQQVNGSLGYGAPWTILAATGATPAQVQQAQMAFDSAAGALRSASTPTASGATVASAQAALDDLNERYASARTNASSLLRVVSDDLATWGRALEELVASIATARNEVQGSSYGDAQSAMSLLSAAQLQVANASTLSSSVLSPALTAYQTSASATREAASAFDEVLLNGSDTAAASDRFAIAATAFALSGPRLATAIDTTIAPLTQAATALSSAQAALSTPTLRANPLFDVPRADVARLVAPLADMQQRASTTKSAIARAGTFIETQAAAVNGGLRAAARALVAAQEQAVRTETQTASVIATAQRQVSGAASQLESLRASEILGPGTITWLPELGAVVRRGERLFAVDGATIPVLYGSVPMYRRISVEMAGPDVMQLETNLAALGYAATADGAFSGSDADALRTWQRAMGNDATGALAVGAVIYVPEAIRVSATHVALGAAYLPGQPILDVTKVAHIVVVQLDATLQTGVKVGDVVTAQLPGRPQPATGRVTAMSSVAQSVQGSQPGQLRATIAVTIVLDDPTAGGSLDQVPVRVSIVDQVRTNVLAVPVTSLVARTNNSFIVHVLSDGQRRDAVVTPGLFGDSGLVEVTSPALKVGDLVEIPRPL